MKTWSVAEIESLMSTVEALGPSTGFRKHIENNPGRSFQACSHMYYRQRMLRALEANRNALARSSDASEKAGSPVEHKAVSEKETNISGFTKFKNWLSKLFS